MTRKEWSVYKSSYLFRQSFSPSTNYSLFCAHIFIYISVLKFCPSVNYSLFLVSICLCMNSAITVRVCVFCLFITSTICTFISASFYHFILSFFHIPTFAPDYNLSLFLATNISFNIFTLKIEKNEMGLCIKTKA